MKRTLIAVLLSIASTTAGAHEGHHARKLVDHLTGEVIDITCYLDHGSSGPQHADCMRKCIERGMPVGLLVKGKVYNVIISSHEAPNAQLAPYAGRLVTITGNVIEKSGARAIDMESVRPVAMHDAAATPTKPL